MIQFISSFEKQKFSETLSTQAFSDIVPERKQMEAPHRYWDEFFNQPTDLTVLSEDELYTQIFEHDPNEFSFEFPLDDELSKILNNFYSEKWSMYSESKKLSEIYSLVNVISEKLQLGERPHISFFDGDEDNLGIYLQGNNQIKINRILLDNPSELVNTLAHELRHAYQYEHALVPQSLIDELYALNFKNYISPGMDTNGFFHSFIDYENQLLEAEARAFASLFSSKEAE